MICQRSSAVLAGHHYARYADPAAGARMMSLVPNLVQGEAPASGGKLSVQSSNGLQRGQLIGPAGPLFGHGDLTALYTTAPSYLPHEAQIFHAPGYHVQIVWLVPITDAEAAYLHMHGWLAFEKVLEDHDLDLADLNRPSVTIR